MRMGIGSRIQVNAKYRKNGRPHDWAVDKDRGIHLRLIQYGGQDPENESASFIFFWKNYEIPVYLWLADYESKERGIAAFVWRMKGGILDKGVLRLPETLEHYRTQIIADLKDALAARNGLVATDEYATCFTTFEF
jgi:hypothetical protein